MSTVKFALKPQWAERLEGIRTERGLSLEEFGRPIPASKAQLSKLARGLIEPTDKFLELFERAYGVSREWLMTGEGAKEVSKRTPDLASQSSVLREEQPFRTVESWKEGRDFEMVPVVSWASAGKAHDYQEMENFIEERVMAPKFGPSTFAVIVEGDSMLPEYKPGDCIILAPHTSPRNGDEVVARVREGEGVLFKLYHVAGDSVTLTSYNPAYPPLHFKKSDLLYAYPVVAMHRRKR